MMKEASVIEVMRDNAKSQRMAAAGFRRDSATALERARIADDRATEWETAVAAIEVTK